MRASGRTRHNCLRLRGTALLAAAFLATLITAGPASVARASSGPWWPSWIGRPAAPNCQAGEVPLVPSRATQDALGVVKIQYHGFPGLTSSFPPRGFSNSNVSPALRADLRRSGLPDNYVDALSVSSGLRATAFCMSSPATAGANWEPVAGGFEPANGISGVDNTHFESINWAGYEVGGTWDGASADWTVEGSAANQLTPNREDTWVGVGGGAQDFNGSNYGLIQLGTEMQTNLGYRSWFEWVCGSCGYSINPTFGSAYGITFSNGNTVRPGDSVSGLVYWNSTTSACFIFTDYSRSSGSFSGCTGNMGIPYDRTTMEWIDESHYWLNGYYLSNFGHTYWSFQDAFNSSTGASLPFTNYGYAADIMADPNTAPVPPCSSAGLMAYPEGASNASSDTVFCRQT